MDVTYRLQGIEFEWSGEKASAHALFRLGRQRAMKGNYMKSPDEEVTLHVRPREKAMVSLEIPTDTLDVIKKVAASRDMSYPALLKLYIGQGLRQDVAKLFADRVLETTAQVLARHIHSEEEVAAILREIQGEVTA